MLSMHELSGIYEEVKDNKEIFIYNLNESFKHRHITYEQLSKRTNINISMLENIFNNKSFPSYIQFISLINILQRC